MTGSATRTFAEIDRRPVDLYTGQVFEMGWQSWSPSAQYPVTATSARPVSRFYQIFYRPECAAPERGFQGEGLLAVQSERDAPVVVYALPAATGEVPSIRAELEGRTLIVRANGPVSRVEDDGPDGIYGALARCADRIAADAHVRELRPVPPVWASWYQYFTEFTERDLARNLDAMDRLELPVGIVRLDDAFQAGIGDWLEPSEGFGSLDGMVQTVLDRGRRAGVWSAPFLVGAHSKTFAEHPDWLVRDPDGAPIRAHVNWGQDCHVLDVTHPAAREYLHRVFTTYRGFGADYFMIDFLYGGAMAGRRHDDVDALGAYHSGMALIRDAIGADSVLQGCGAPMFPSVGFVDTMRVGADIAPDYAAHHDELGNPGGECAPISTIGRAFTQGRLWINDPDCLVARPAIARREQWADVVERYGAVRISSDGLDELDEWGLATTRRLLTPSRTEPFEATSVPLDSDVVTAALRGRDQLREDGSA